MEPPPLRRLAAPTSPNPSHPKVHLDPCQDPPAPTPPPRSTPNTPAIPPPKTTQSSSILQHPKISSRCPTPPNPTMLQNSPCASQRLHIPQCSPPPPPENLPPPTHGAPSSPSAPRGAHEVVVPSAGGPPRRWQAMGRGPGGVQRGRGGRLHLVLCALAPVPVPASAAAAAAPAMMEELGGPQPCWGMRGVNGGARGTIEMGEGGKGGVVSFCLLALFSFHLWGSGWLFRL